MYLLTLNLSRKITAVANLINCVRDVRSFLIPFLSTPSTANVVNRGRTLCVLTFTFTSFHISSKNVL